MGAVHQRRQETLVGTLPDPAIRLPIFFFGFATKSIANGHGAEASRALRDALRAPQGRGDCSMCEREASRALRDALRAPQGRGDCSMCEREASRALRDALRAPQGRGDCSMCERGFLSIPLPGEGYPGSPAEFQGGRFSVRGAEAKKTGRRLRDGARRPVSMTAKNRCWTTLYTTGRVLPLLGPHR